VLPHTKDVDRNPSVTLAGSEHPHLMLVHCYSFGTPQKLRILAVLRYVDMDAAIDE
jgi:hypothetical protein